MGRYGRAARTRGRLGADGALALSAGALIGARRRRDLEVKIEALRAETRTLADAAERARSLLEAQGDLIVRRDVDACITYVNDAFCALIGRARGADRHALPPGRAAAGPRCGPG